jgi:hypothetical protein
MQFDDRKRRRDRTIGRDPHRHFAFDCQASEVVEIQGVAVSPDLTLEEASSDWSLHPELLYGARPRATNLIADQTIAGCYPKLRDSVLDLIGFSERQDKTRIREAHPGLTRAVVAPLAISQLLKRVHYGAPLCRAESAPRDTGRGLTEEQLLALFGHGGLC